MDGSPEYKTFLSEIQLNKNAFPNAVNSLNFKLNFTFGVQNLCGGRGHRALVKFKSSVLCKLMSYIGHLGYLIPHLMNKKADFRFQVVKKWTSKAEKMRKWPKTANFGHVLVFLSD